MSKRAIAYVSDVILGRTGEIVSRDEQRSLLEAYAAENDVEVIHWYEDSVYQEDVSERPGVVALLDRATDYDLVLVERVWSLSREWTQLKPFLQNLTAKKVKLESATMLWDCVSQMSRQFFRPNANRAACARPVVVREGAAARTRKPARLSFSGLKRV